MVLDLIAVICLGALYASIFWPGLMTADSLDQYAQAVSGCYTNHHPPLMAWVWRLFNTIVPGPCLMLVFHVSLLFAALYFLMQTIPTSRLRYGYLAFPFIPHVLSQAGFIWKDVGFAVSFLCVASYLASVSFQRRRLLWVELIALLPILFYGTAVKFQAQYCAPLLITWAAFLLTDRRFIIQTAVFFTFMMIPFYASLSRVNSVLVTTGENSHSWQLVKLFDLAQMSIDLQHDFIPHENKTAYYSWDKLNSTFTIRYVDPLIFPKDAILKRGANHEERQQLLTVWWNTITTHPLLYLKHRAQFTLLMLTNIVGARYIEPVLVRCIPQQGVIYNTASACLSLVGFALLSPLAILLLALIYCLLGLVWFRRSPAAQSLFFFNAISLTLFVVLLFFSMATDTRYIYPAVCLTHASHIFAYLLMRRNLLPV